VLLRKPRRDTGGGFETFSLTMGELSHALLIISCFTPPFVLDFLRLLLNAESPFFEDDDDFSGRLYLMLLLRGTLVATLVRLCMLGEILDIGKGRGSSSASAAVIPGFTCDDNSDDDDDDAGGGGGEGDSDARREDK